MGLSGKRGERNPQTDSIEGRGGGGIKERERDAENHTASERDAEKFVCFAQLEIHR